MSNLLGSFVHIQAVKRAVISAANWVDLQWSVTISQLRKVAPRARGTLLDVGCGCKPYMSIFAPYVARYVGLELESTFSGTAAASLSVQPDVYYDGKRIPFDEESFDTVLSIQVLEHTPTPQELLNEMSRVLRRDGVLILSAPFSFRLHEEPHDYFRYSPHGLRVMCEKAGLQVQEVWPQGSLWSVLGHQMNSFLAFQVGKLDGFTQSLGKLTHEETSNSSPRFLALPFVVPAMVLISGAARVLDKVFPDRTMALGYLIIANRPSKF